MNTYTEPGHCTSILLASVAPSPNSSMDAKAWVCGVGLCGLCIGAVSWELTIFKIIITLSLMLAPVIFDIYRYQLLPTSKNIQLKTSKSKKKVEIDEIEFQSPDQLVNFIKGLDGNS